MENWIVDVVRELGPLGVALLMLGENIAPPVPSEIIMPLAGYLSARGEMNLVLAIAAGTFGSLAGTSFWYWVGRKLSRKDASGWIGKHGIWLALTPQDVDRAVEWFERRGQWGVALGRLVPFVRTLISVPAGFARMPLWRFLLFSLLGTAAWTAALAVAGHVLGARFQEAERFVGPVTWVVIGGAAVIYVYRVIRIARSRRR